MAEYRAPRGTKDILPPASGVWSYVESRLREIYRRYNYHEIRTPIFEETLLFVRGVGDTTDIVEKEMYTFTDKGKRSLTLRPEGTAPVVRSYIENKLYGQPQPLKFFYIGPMFRYERPQAGRYRQHHQTGVEVIGGDSALIDAEVIGLGLEILREFELQNWQVHLNSIGCKACRPHYIEKLKEYLSGKNGLCNDCKSRLTKNPLRSLDCKNPACREIIKKAPLVVDFLCDPCQAHFLHVQKYLSLQDIDFTIDPYLVRGLDYYTRTAFEIKTNKLGAQDSIFGGGRYDGLSEELGGPTAPGMGFGLGLERLLLALEEEGQLGFTSETPDAYFIVIGDEEVTNNAWRLLFELRHAGLQAEMDLLLRSPKSQMKAANRNNAKYTVFIGEEELRNDSLKVRNMSNGTEFAVKMTELVNFFKG